MACRLPSACTRLSELGQDYLKAGLLDRAEEIFVKLRGTDRDEEALKNLLEIYQQEKEWAKAAAIAEAMPNHSDHLWQKAIAEFRCELAANEMLHDRHDAARACSTKPWRPTASASAPRCCSATWRQKSATGETAIDYWKRVEQQNPVYLALAAEKLMASHIQLGRMEQGIQLLRGWLERHPSLDLTCSIPVRSGPSSTMAAPRRRTCWCATSCGAIRRCSDSTSCSRRRSSSRRRSVAPTSS
jgi:lipopolysaccharide biosynthesis regulator YciM